MHRNWPHSQQLPTGLAGCQGCTTAQTFWRSQICPSLSGQGSGVSIGTHPNSLWGLSPFPAHRVRVQRSLLLQRGWPSVLLALRCCILLKLGLLPLQAKRSPRSPNERRCDPQWAGPRPLRSPAQASIVSPEDFERPSPPSPGPYPSFSGVRSSRPTTLFSCQHPKPREASRRLPASEPHGGEPARSRQM